MKKIVWLDLNCSYAHSSLALPALHAQMMDDERWQWQVVSATINEPVGQTVERLVLCRPDLVCGTLWLFNHEAMMHLLERLHALAPQAVILLGGPEFLGDNEAFLRRYRCVAGVFRGEGEESFPLWADAWSRQAESMSHIPGYCYLDEAGQYHDGGKAMVAHFGRLVPPEASPLFNWSKPFVQLETTRGCFNTCAFCVSGGEKPVRTLSMDAIRNRLQTIRAHGIRQIRVLDRTFNYQPRRALELIRLFCEFPEMQFHLEMHPALLCDELKEVLPTLPAGLLHLEAGIQSLREEVLAASCRHGRLGDALDGLRFLCSLTNMETHADLIAGLPLYHLSQIFDDVRTLASYRAGEIQLELLKLLPGTEMRRRSDELGICYSPLPPYEVLQTREISVSELQRARQLSRLLDAFYNASAWQSVTRQLILHSSTFLPSFLDYLIGLGLIDQPMSLEKRGLLLYRYCLARHPDFAVHLTLAWIEAGMSLKKEPAEHVQTKRIQPPSAWNVIYGTYRPSLRLSFLPADDAGHGYWFGHDAESQQPEPVFRAETW